MPASTLDPINAALCTALSKTTSEKSLDSQLAGSTKRALLADIEFESAGSYHSTVLDQLKSKYTVLKSSDSPQASKPENMGADETLTLAKYVLYPIENVQLGWNNSDWSVGCGMVNMGNTCYLNSILQALFHVPALVNWLISDKKHMAECEDSSGGFCIICAMRKTLQESQNPATTSIRPFLIYNKLRVVCRNLIPGRQEDAHEFLRYLVEAMEKAYLNRFKNHSTFDSKTKETTPLNQILGGYLRTTVRCLECGHISTTFQHFQDLLLDIRKVQTLDEALQIYFSREKLDDDSYNCEACQKKVPATKQFLLERAPMVLCIQLKRFSVTNNKITKHIQFRQRLEMSRYTSQRPSLPLVYRLVALVTHMGPTVGCGHYTAVAQAPSGSFYQFDDSMVRPISHQGVFNTNAYIMLYELESAPFAQKPSPISANNKVKNASSSSTTSSESSFASSKSNGFSSDKVYGPELPASVANKIPTVNGIISTVNGKSKHSESSPSSSECDSELPAIKYENKQQTAVSNSFKVKENETQKSPSPKLTASLGMPSVDSSNNVSNSTKKDRCNSVSPVNNISTNNRVNPLNKETDRIAQMKLVPYDVDDSSNCSEESSQSPAEADTCISPKSTVRDWKVTAASNVSAGLSSEGKSWDKKKVQSDRGTVNELLRMSHKGYGAPVSSWNGTRAQLDKEVINERREDRKRMSSDNGEQVRTKHQKIHSNGSYKSNPGYNPIQEFHNASNWNNHNSNGSQYYRQFFNTGSRHRRNFHHKNYNKNFRFRH